MSESMKPVTAWAVVCKNGEFAPGHGTHFVLFPSEDRAARYVTSWEHSFPGERVQKVLIMPVEEQP